MQKFQLALCYHQQVQKWLPSTSTKTNKIIINDQGVSPTRGEAIPCSRYQKCTVIWSRNASVYPMRPWTTPTAQNDDRSASGAGVTGPSQLVNTRESTACRTNLQAATKSSPPRNAITFHVWCRRMTASRKCCGPHATATARAAKRAASQVHVCGYNDGRREDEVVTV
jgi:hypothetical protein